MEGDDKAGDDKDGEKDADEKISLMRNSLIDIKSLTFVRFFHFQQLSLIQFFKKNPVK